MEQGRFYRVCHDEKIKNIVEQMINDSIISIYQVCEQWGELLRSIDIVNITLHFFLKDVRPMLPPVMNRSIAAS